MGHDSSIWDMTHPHGTWYRQKSWNCLTYQTWLIHMWHDSFIRDMTHPYGTRLIHMWQDKGQIHGTASPVRYFSLICNMTLLYVTWFFYTWHDLSIQDMTHSCILRYRQHSWNCLTSQTVQSFEFQSCTVWEVTWLKLKIQKLVTWMIHAGHDSSIWDTIQAKFMKLPHLSDWLPKQVFSLFHDSLPCVAVCCSVLQCVAVCCSVLQCVAVFCSVLQCGAVCCSVLQCPMCCCVLMCVAVSHVLQCVVVCCSVL